MNFSGDNTGSGGTEVARIDLGSAFEDGAFNEDALVDLNAGWYGSGGGTGPASLTVYTEKLQNETMVTSSAVSFVINPGSQTNCASTDVGLARVSVAINGTVTIDVIPADFEEDNIFSA